VSCGTPWWSPSSRRARAATAGHTRLTAPSPVPHCPARNQPPLGSVRLRGAMRQSLMNSRLRRFRPHWRASCYRWPHVGLSALPHQHGVGSGIVAVRDAASRSVTCMLTGIDRGTHGVARRSHRTRGAWAQSGTWSRPSRTAAVAAVRVNTGLVYPGAGAVEVADTVVALITMNRSSSRRIRSSGSRRLRQLPRGNGRHRIPAALGVQPERAVAR
jgi:hypothetical protein